MRHGFYSRTWMGRGPDSNVDDRKLPRPDGRKAGPAPRVGLLPENAPPVVARLLAARRSRPGD